MTVLAQNISSGFEGIKKQTALRREERGGFVDALDDVERDFVQLQISCHKLPKTKEPIHMSIRVPLPHAITDANTNVILITKDLKKGIKTRHEDTLRHYCDLLHKHDAKSLVSMVISLRQLKVEYKDFEAKRKLSQIADVVLCDDTVIRLVPQLLGKFFYKKRKHPIQVNLKAKNLKTEIKKALSLSHLHLSMEGNCGMMNVGRVSNTQEEISENVQAVIKKLKERFPGGWSNVKSINMKTSTSNSVPIYLNLETYKDDVVHPLKKKIVPVKGDMAFSDAKEIAVYPSGDVFINFKPGMENTEEYMRYHRIKNRITVTDEDKEKESVADEEKEEESVADEEKEKESIADEEKEEEKETILDQEEEKGLSDPNLSKKKRGKKNAPGGKKEKKTKIVPSKEDKKIKKRKVADNEEGTEKTKKAKRARTSL